MSRKIEVAVTDRYDHTVMFVFTSHRILQVRYLNHPGLGTQALARAQRLTRYVVVEVCTCMRLANGLANREFRYVSDLISERVTHKEFEEMVVPLYRSIQLIAYIREHGHAP